MFKGNSKGWPGHKPLGRRAAAQKAACPLPLSKMALGMRHSLLAGVCLVLALQQASARMVGLRIEVSQVVREDFLRVCSLTAPCWHPSQLGAVQDPGNFVVEPQSTLVLVEGSSLEGQLDGPDDFMQPFGFQTVDLSWRSWSVANPLAYKLALPCLPMKGACYGGQG